MSLRNFYRPFQKVRLSLYDLCAFVIILAASSLRIVLITLGWPVMNGDEAIMVAMAQHISEGKEHPIFFYGQNYLGTLEAYFGALLFNIFGTSVWSMRLGSVLFYTGFLICMYILTSRIFTKSLALFVLFLLGLGTQYVLAYQISALGYTELPFLCALLFLLSYILATGENQQRRWSRAIVFLLWGLLAGAMVWEQLVTAPYILVSGLLLVLCCWRSLLKGAVWLVVLGLIVGAWPLISYNLHAAPGADSLHTFLGMSSLGSGNHYLLYDYISSTLFIILPASLGLFPRCLHPGDAVQSHFSTPQPSLCGFAANVWRQLSRVVLCLNRAG